MDRELIPWRTVTSAEFAAFLERYPRALLAEPPADRRAQFRTYSDPTRGSWPACVVAKYWIVRSGSGYQIRADLDVDLHIDSDPGVRGCRTCA